MTSIPYQSTVRQWKRCPPINSAVNDHNTKNGVRISLPCYVDLTNQQRKTILNALRSKIADQTVTSTPASASGIRVETTSNTESDIESYIGMSMDVLRTVIFQRGGLEASLVLRLQEVSGVELVTDKDFTAAFKQRQDMIKKYTTEYPFIASE